MLRDIQNPSGYSPRQPALADPALSRVLGRKSPEVLNFFVILCPQKYQLLWTIPIHVSLSWQDNYFLSKLIMPLWCQLWQRGWRSALKCRYLLPFRHLRVSKTTFHGWLLWLRIYRRLIEDSCLSGLMDGGQEDIKVPKIIQDAYT